MGLCRALGLATIAEGVESEATLRQLRELGCTYGQGNLFGRPMPAAEAGRLLDAQGQVAGQMTLGR
jgi:EAL domain-containing protein (putative c-di-GMP-specific phosphodiesterase class I)